MLFSCKYCGGRFCEEHRLPETHDCPKVYNKLKEEANDLLLTLIPDVKIKREVESEFWKIIFS